MARAVRRSDPAPPVAGLARDRYDGDALGSAARAFIDRAAVPLLHKPFEPAEALAIVRRVASQKL
jgi:hypothetical protein